MATGARPYDPGLPLEGVETLLSAWDVLAAPGRTGRALVADWGGDASGPAAAELLAAAGCEVTLALGSAAFGETLHQYQRNLYAQRLYRAGVRIEHHLDLTGAGPEGVRFRNLFARELEATLPADLLVLALGRVPAQRPRRGARGKGRRRRRGGRLPEPTRCGGGDPGRHPRRRGSRRH